MNSDLFDGERMVNTMVGGLEEISRIFVTQGKFYYIYHRADFTIYIYHLNMHMTRE